MFLLIMTHIHGQATFQEDSWNEADNDVRYLVRLSLKVRFKHFFKDSENFDASLA
jgi:hypothetical protein